MGHGTSEIVRTRFLLDDKIRKILGIATGIYRNKTVHKSLLVKFTADASDC